jgi:release factor glutamine methyltransferase
LTTIENALNFGVQKLRGEVEKPRLEAELLLSHLLAVDRIYLFLYREKELSLEIEKDFLSFIERRFQREPIEYILKKVSFYSRTFFIDKGALIPRPETEILIDIGIEKGREFQNPRILEIGVGSGIVSIMLATLLENSSIFGVDISEKALQIAEKNRKDFKVEERVEFIKSDLFEKIDKNKKFDIIISNPPYISNSERGKLQKELDFEPEIALFGGNIGDEILKTIIDLFFEKDSKYLICEMGYDQKRAISRYVDNRGVLEFYKDLAGFDRGFILKKQEMF